MTTIHHSIKTIKLFCTILFVWGSTNTIAQCVVLAPVPNDACYQQVIAADSWCCDVSWDATCQAAYDACVPPPPPPCVVVAPVPADACYDQVVAADSWCCDVSWDATCQAAYDACNPGGGGPDPCASITPLIGCGTSTGANMSGTGSWNIGACGWSTPGVELIFSFTATASGIHSLDITSISGGFVDFMWIDATSGCSSAAPWNCITSTSLTGNYGAMNWTAGNTYYILLDPQSTGASSVAFDVNCPNPGGPAIAGDCDVAIPVCTDLAFAIDPNGYGNYDELCTSCTSNPALNPSGLNSGCLLSGELNSTWFTVNVAAGGTLEFSFGSPGTGNCYDWIMWPYDATTCTDIMANTLAPNACNWNSPCNGYTGMASTPPPLGSPGNFEPTTNVSAGDQYLICFSNFSSALTTVPLDFFGTADISCTLLPVEMLDFSGTDQGGYNQLNWTTGAEINSSHFAVQRSYDGTNFETFEEVTASGTSLSSVDYRAEDYHPGEQVTYYRLKQYNTNNEFDYSSIIAVSNEKSREFKIVSAYPNPAQDIFNIAVLVPEDGTIEVDVMEATGKHLAFDVHTTKRGVNYIQVPVSKLSRGMYMVTIYNPQSGKKEMVKFAIE